MVECLQERFMAPFHLAAFVPAAGFSSRMKDFKPLLPLGDATVLDQALRSLREGGVEDIRVVTGHRREELTGVLEKWGVREVVNSRFREGMFSSVKAGLASAPPLRGAFFMLPVDLPAVRPQTLRDLALAREASGAGIVYPVLGGARGHPPLIDGSYIPGILRWEGGGGLKGFLDRHEDDALDVETADAGVLTDLDTPEDYERLLLRWPKRDIPTPRECEALMTRVFQVRPGIFDHCRAVARAALRMAEALDARGASLDLDLVEAASLLHDVAKGRPRHALEGARMLGERGYPDVARVVEVHADFDPPEDGPVDEREVVHLADKLVEGERPVALEDRFGGKLQRYGHDPRAAAAIRARMERALSMRRRMEAIWGRSLEEVLREPERRS